MKKFTLSMFMVLAMSIANVWAANYEYTHTFSEKISNGTATWSDVEWTCNLTGNSLFMESTGVRFAKDQTVELTTSAFAGYEITDIKVSTYSTGATINVTVGGDTYISEDITTSSSDYYVYGHGASQGDLKITYTLTDQTASIKSMTICYKDPVVAGPETDGDGTAEVPYSVADVLLLEKDDATEAWVEGYIIGVMKMKKGGAYDLITSDFATAGVNGNIVLADVSAGYTEYIAVQLPDGDVKNALNLQANPTNCGQQVAVYGKLNKFQGNYGVKEVSEYYWVADGPPTALENVKTNQQAVKVIMNGQVMVVRDGKLFNLLGQEMK